MLDHPTTASAGYPLTSCTIRTFNEVELRLLPADEHDQALEFNKIVTSQRTHIEHAFGQLKGRFPFLREAIGRDDKRMWLCITACVILHNMMKDWNDGLGDMDDWDDNPEGEDEDIAVGPDRNGAAAEENANRDGAGERERGKEIRLQLIQDLEL